MRRRIAIVNESFPLLSGNYELWFVEELVRARQHIALFPMRVMPSRHDQAEIERYDLRRHIYGDPAPWPSSRQGQLLKAWRDIALALRRRPLEMSRLPSLVRSHGLTGVTQVLHHLAHVQDSALRRAHLIHAHYGPSGRRAQMFRDLQVSRAPLVTSFLGFDLSLIPRQRSPRYYARLFEQSERLCVSSQYMRGLLVELGAPPERVQLLPLGLPVRRFPYTTRHLERGAQMRLITAARLVPVKGIDWGLRGVALARQRGVKLTWDIYGDGPERERLERMVDHLELRDEVTFHGFHTMTTIRATMRRAHLCLFPGVTNRFGAEEALGGAILEAQACGLPVLASHVGGIAEAFVPGASGVLVAQKEPGAIADALVHLASRPDLWPAMSRAARRHVETHYDSERLCLDWLRLYDQLLSKKGRASSRAP